MAATAGRGKRAVREAVAAPAAAAAVSLTLPQPIAEEPSLPQLPAPDPVAAAPLASVPPSAEAIDDTAAEPPAPIVTPASDIPPAAVPADIAHEDETMATIIENTTTDTGAKAGAMFEDFNTRAKGAMEKGAQMFEEINSFGKGNLEAIVESSKIAVKGMESLGQEAAEFTRKSFEGATQQMKTLASTKSPTEFFKLQSDFMRSMFDTMVAETSRSTEMVLKLANDAAQPISSRVALAAEKIKVAA